MEAGFEPDLKKVADAVEYQVTYTNAPWENQIEFAVVEVLSQAGYNSMMYWDSDEQRAAAVPKETFPMCVEGYGDDGTAEFGGKKHTLLPEDLGVQVAYAVMKKISKDDKVRVDVRWLPDQGREYSVQLFIC